MPQKIRVAVVGEGEQFPRLIHAILEKDVIPPENMFLSQKNKLSQQGAEGFNVTFMADDMSAVIKGEIVLVCASKREFSTVLAPISQCTSGRMVVALCPDESLNVTFVSERVVNGTIIAVAPFTLDENGEPHARVTFARNVLPFMQRPCLDLLGALCDVETTE